MSTRVVDLVDEWDERSFSGGYRALHELADETFSGVVRSGGAELYMTKGTVVGIRRGDIEDFEDSGGTAYQSPSPTLPLLAVMQERDVDVRAKYYSEKTPMSEIDDTLSDGGFTGYVELSENVLSGDYYLVYHGGRSMNVGFVGASGRLIDGDEAFETANDEVGIFKVRQVDIDAIEIPEPADDGQPAAAPDPETAASQPAEESEPTTQSSEQSGADHSTTADPEPEPETQAGPEPTEAATQSNTERSQLSATQTDPERGQSASTPEEPQQRESTEPSQREGPASGQHRETAETTTPSPDPDRSEQSKAGTSEADPSEQQQTDDAAVSEPSTVEESDRTAGQSATTQTDSKSTPRQDASGGRATDQRADTRDRHTERDDRGFQPSSTGQPDQIRDSRGTEQFVPSSTSAENLDLETRAVPSLDPAQTEPTSQQDSSVRDSLDRNHNQSGTASRQDQQPRDQSRGDRTPEQPTESPRSPDSQAEPAADETETVDSERIEELEAEIDDRDDEISRLESELTRKETENDDLREQLDTVREERDELQSEVEQLESELTRLEDELGAATDAERRMTAAEALAGTDVFIRYESKGDATLAKAHDGSLRKDDVNGNLKLEKHTQFDAAQVSVGGQSYPEFLEGTLGYQFVEWVVRELLFEIRDTGHDTALKDLYDALPKTDRAELSGVVDVVYTEDGQETRSQESFDIILRNRMGNPLLVANLNDSREAATESMMENLITAAERVGQTSDEFAGAFLVTRSFFEPPALETASEATQGGLLSRDKRKSFVNLSRKKGYHLCLVEARNENFHLAVPEL